MHLEQGEIAFWVLIISILAAVGYMWYELNKDKKKEKKS